MGPFPSSSRCSRTGALLIGALLAEATLAAGSDAAVLGPRLKLALHRALEATSGEAAKPVARPPIHVVLRADPNRLQAAVAACGGSVRTVIDDIATALIPPEGLVRLARKDGVSRIELAGRSFPHPVRFKPQPRPGTLRFPQSSGGSFSTDELPPELPDAAALHQGAPPLSRPYTGKGVVIGFFDTGINFRHLDFRGPDDPTKSRILFIRVPVDRDELLSGRISGTEWTRDQIEAALKGGPDQPSADELDHGTLVAGTAAGNGAATGSHAGMAPEADLVMVHGLRGASYLEAADYIYGKAAEKGMPAVVNQSSWSGSISLFPTLEEEGLEKLIRAAPGRAYVAAAGNGGEFLGHWGGFPLQRDSLWTFYKPVSVDSSLVDSFFLALNWDDRLILEGIVLGPKVEESSLALALDTERPEGEPLDGAQLAGTAWYSLSDLARDVGDWDLVPDLDGLNIDREFAASETLISAGGDTLGSVNLAASPLEAGGGGFRFLLEAEKLSWASDSRSVLWRLMARGQGTIHVWSWLGEGVIRRDLDAETGYRPADNYYMVISPGTSEEVIAVGAYANMEVPAIGLELGDLLPFSSRGPTIDERIKPDLAAPGITYSTSHVGIDGRAGGAGTSLSAPVVAGAVALYLENHPTATSREIREALFASARRDRFTSTFGELPNRHWGHGKLDIIAALTGQRTLVSVADASAPRPEAFQLHPNFPNPFNAGTTLSFGLPAGGEVTLAVYNLLGQRVGLLLDRHFLPAGQHTFRYRETGLGSGTYLLALQSGDARTTRRMTLAK